MAPRYRAALALTLALAASLPADANAARRPHAKHHAYAAAAAPSVIYSRRALRRAKIILELKLMELRAERLERVRKAIQRHVPIDEILRENP